MQNEKPENPYRRKGYNCLKTIITAFISDVYNYPRYCHREQFNCLSRHLAGITNHAYICFHPSYNPHPVGMAVFTVFAREMLENS